MSEDNPRIELLVPPSWVNLLGGESGGVQHFPKYAERSIDPRDPTHYRNDFRQVGPCGILGVAEKERVGVVGRLTSDEAGRYRFTLGLLRKGAFERFKKGPGLITEAGGLEAGAEGYQVQAKGGERSKVIIKIEEKPKESRRASFRIEASFKAPIFVQEGEDLRMRAGELSEEIEGVIKDYLASEYGDRGASATCLYRL